MRPFRLRSAGEEGRRCLPHMIAEVKPDVSSSSRTSPIQKHLNLAWFNDQKRRNVLNALFAYFEDKII